MKRTIPLLAVLLLVAVVIPAAAAEENASDGAQAYVLKARFVTFTPVVPFQLDEESYPVDMRLPSLPRTPAASTEDDYQIVRAIEGLDGTATDEDLLAQLAALDPSFNYCIAASVEANAGPGEAIGLQSGAVDQPLPVGGTTDYAFSISLGVPQPHKTGAVIVQHDSSLTLGETTLTGSGPPVAVVPGATYSRMMAGGRMLRKDDEEGRLRVEKWWPGYMLILSLMPAGPGSEAL